MKEERRPTLTLCRKTEPGQDDAGSAVPGVRGTRKKQVIVNTPPGGTVNVVAPEEKAPDEPRPNKAARRAEKARLWAERKAAERAALRAANRKPPPPPVYRTLISLEEAVSLFQRCWPALVEDGQVQLLDVNIRQAMLDDIRERELAVSGKTLRRCLAAITRSDGYLGAMTVGAWRRRLDGQPVTEISADEAAYARERIAREHAKRVRRQAAEQQQAASHKV